MSDVRTSDSGLASVSSFFLCCTSPSSTFAQHLPWVPSGSCWGCHGSVSKVFLSLTFWAGCQDSRFPARLMVRGSLSGLQGVAGLLSCLPGAGRHQGSQVRWGEGTGAPASPSWPLTQRGSRAAQPQPGAACLGLGASVCTCGQPRCSAQMRCSPF